MKLRYRILVYYVGGGYAAVVQMRREHVDPPLRWDDAFKTEPYGDEAKAKRRAKAWVIENHPEAIE